MQGAAKFFRSSHISLRFFLTSVVICCALGAFWGWTLWSVYYAGGQTVLTAPEADTELEITELRDGFFVIAGSGSHVTVSTGPDGLLLVDTGFEHMAPAVRAALDKIDPSPVVRIISTHFHTDHTGANAQLSMGNADIVSHLNTRKHIVESLKYPPEGVPTIVLEDRLEFEFNGQTVQLIHAPAAHTDGDVVAVFQPANIIATGDVLSTSLLPYLSRGTGATLDGHLEGQSLLLSLSNDETLIVPGLGPLPNRREVADLNADLQRIRDRIAWIKSQGFSRRYGLLFHPLYGWPKDRQLEGDWEKFWYGLAWATLP